MTLKKLLLTLTACLVLLLSITMGVKIEANTSANSKVQSMTTTEWPKKLKQLDDGEFIINLIEAVIDFLPIANFVEEWIQDLLCGIDESFDFC